MSDRATSADIARIETLILVLLVYVSSGWTRWIWISLLILNATVAVLGAIVVYRTKVLLRRAKKGRE